MNDNVNASTTFWFVIVLPAKWNKNIRSTSQCANSGRQYVTSWVCLFGKFFVNDNLICATAFASNSQRLIRPHTDRLLKRTPQFQSPQIISSQTIFIGERWTNKITYVRVIPLPSPSSILALLSVVEHWANTIRISAKILDVTNLPQYSISNGWIEGRNEKVNQRRSNKPTLNRWWRRDKRAHPTHTHTPSKNKTPEWI